MALEMQSQFMVVIPDGVMPGQLMQAPAPDGQLIQFPVPAGYGPGMQVPVAYRPMQAAAVPLAVAGAAVMPTQQVMYAGVSDPWGLLASLNAIKIKEKVQLAEVLVGFEMPNKYMCSDPVTGQDLFVAAEKSQGVMGMLGRQVFEGGNRPFNMDIALLTGMGQPPLPFIHMERPFACTCCCFNRPEVFISNPATGEAIGSVVDPFACCQMTFDIKDASGSPVLEISHSVFDCALCCWGCPCGCQEVTFEVNDKSGIGTVGTITKKLGAEEAVGMITGLGVDASRYEVNFGGVQSGEWKAMLLATALFLDFRFFNAGGQSQRDESMLGRILEG